MDKKRRFDRLARVIAFLFGATFSPLSAAPAHAETITLPVAISATGAGGVSFVSDVRVFNTSYTDVLTVTAIYRFGGHQSTFQLAPREARAFDDICVGLFATPDSLGAIDFITTGQPGQLTVTSQLRSPAPQGGHVGMFVPGLPQSAADPDTVLTSLVNGPSRTNIGVYNPTDASVSATIRLFDGPVLLGTIPVSLGPHAVTQFNDVYRMLGFESLVKTDGYATVTSASPSSPLFTFAAEADNASGDLILIVGSADVPAPAGFFPPTPTPTPASAGPTATPTSRPPTPTPTPVPPTHTPTPSAAVVVNMVATEFQWSINGGGNQFVMHVGQSYELHISDGDPAGRTPHGFSGIPGLGISAKSLQAGGSPSVVMFTPSAGQTGTFFFSCNQPSCGSGHSNMIASIQVMP
jgi:heme/copper-type cytochrome/quinol oxidase subunit 2